MHTILARAINHPKGVEYSICLANRESAIPWEANLLMLFDERIPFYILGKHVE
ncbi:MAG: hypothetical protein IPK10_03355 [Bacteroidetes bacterium]|nr:hypothetical protein [Bacteroidota bacterium]